MKTIILILFLFGTSFSFGQYKRMSIGYEYCFFETGKTGNYNSSFNRLNLNSLTVQYNFKKIVSLKSGIGFERYDFKLSKEVDISGVNSYHRRDYIDINSKFIVVPMLLKATFGRNFSFYVNICFNTSFSLKSPYWGEALETATGLYKYYDISGEVQASRKIELNLVQGFGFSTQIKERVSIYADFKMIVRNDKVKNPPYYDFRNYCGVLLNAGITYQFNFSKKSDYKFSSYRIGT